MLNFSAIKISSFSPAYILLTKSFIKNIKKFIVNSGKPLKIFSNSSFGLSFK